MRISPFVLSLGLISHLMSAGPVLAWTPQEIRAMPPYCAGRYARFDYPAEYKRWEAQYGPDFLHTHKLCDGIGLLNNSYKAKTPQARKWLLDEAIYNFNYMVQHAKPDFRLMPEVYWYRSRAYHLLNQTGQAIADLRKAIDLDPGQARFYIYAAEYLDTLRQKDEALKLVSEGLRRLPEHKGLKTLYGRLGGQLPYAEPYPGAGGEAQANPKPSASSSQETAVASREPRSAIFDLSRATGTARKEAPILNAGAHLFVELREDLSAPELVHLRIQSQIPQPAARIPSIAIDTGRFGGLIGSVEVKDPLLGKYYPIKPIQGDYSHAYWPKDFTPDFMARFTIDPEEGKMYDPRSLAPGSALNLQVKLAAGKSFEDFLEAMRLGLRSPEGVRIGVIAHHLMGYRPDPSQTIMDDAGFLTGSLRRLAGFERAQQEPIPQTQGQLAAQGEEAARQAVTSQAQSQATRDDLATTINQTKPGIGTPTNPWCRFCPQTTPK